MGFKPTCGSVKPSRSTRLKRLPKRLSALLKFAVEDCKLVERAARRAKKLGKTAKYVLCMQQWHSPDLGAGGSCEVCMAGAVMAKHLSADAKATLAPEDYSPFVRGQLRAIDQLRGGTLPSYGVGRSVKQQMAVMAINTIIRKNLDADLDRAPWPTYLAAAKLLRVAGL